MGGIMARLASPIGEIKNHYTIVVVGSGYGGGITASRLARAGQQVCVLERGKEFLPGEFPDTLPEALEEMQLDTPSFQIGSNTGLFDFHVNDDINVLVGCGLGGTSLINANVVLKADPRVFEDPAWPKELVDDLNNGIQKGYDRAKEMLTPQPYPENFPKLKKLKALEKSAAFIGEKFYRPPLAVTFEQFKNSVNHVGVEQKPCVLCGDCVSGCNHTSKNTVQMNYLPDAHNHGAQIFTGTNVRYIEKENDRWLVHYEIMGLDRDVFDAPTLFVGADIVVLAAGTLGSTEILLRSKENGLPVSDMLGRQFTGNGDVLAFGYNNDQEISGVGLGSREPDPDDPIGPCITGIIDTRSESPVYREGMSIEEGVIPGALSPILPISFLALSKIIGEDTDEGLVDYIQEKKRELESFLLKGPYNDAVDHTQTFLVMTHDSCSGIMYLKDDRLRIDWPGVGKEPIFEKVEETLKKAVTALGGTYMKSPISTKLFGHDLVTVHPLGGCIMAEEASKGVVNHKGQVFKSKSGEEVYDGLYVADGAMIPTSLGTNPLLTISAIAERNVSLLAEERGWKIDYTFLSKPSKPAEPLKLGIQFTETMKGYFSSEHKNDFEKGYEQGEADDSPFKFTLTIRSLDLDQMLKNENHQARMVGTVQAPALSPEPLTVSKGHFNLFVTDKSNVNTRQMRYRMQLNAEDGRHFYFYGYKIIHDDSGFDSWSDTTTLYMTLWEGENDKGSVIGKGIIKINSVDFFKQMTTIKALNPSSMGEQLKALADFGGFFAKNLYQIYGSVLSQSNTFNPDAPPRKKRCLRMDPPEVHYFTTHDNVRLRLTRYKGGKKGPVLVTPGFGTSILAYTIDTVETNFPEFLFANGYDIWLFDYRASPALQSAGTQFTLDDIAFYDYPAAVAKVRELTGADTLQIMAHCIGSMTFLMSMCSGLNHVRSSVCSNLTAYPAVPVLTQIKTKLYLATLLDTIGIKFLSTDYDPKSWKDKLFDQLLKFHPTNQPVDGPTDRRILFMYGEVYKIAQLNAATHKALHEMFGVANISTFKHISKFIRAGHMVNSQAADIYLPQVQNLAIPISFIHGEENYLFLPEGSKKTMEWLCHHNNPELYTRHVIKDYAHLDCFIGRNASRDVYPIILNELDQFN